MEGLAMTRCSVVRAGRLGAGIAALLGLAVPGAFAQITNDSVPRERTVPVKEQIDRELQSARWRLGPFRFLPQLQITGPTYDNNVFDASGEEPKVSDWYAIFGAGLGVVIPIGRSVYVRGSAVPEYIWYDRLADRRQWGGSYGGTLNVFLGRAAFEGGYGKTLTPQYPNTETLVQVLGETDRADGKIEIPLTRAISLFGSAIYQTINDRPLGQDVPESENPYGDLNRKEGAARGGLRYKISSYFDVGLGAEGTRTEFDQDPANADNESTAFLAAVYFNRPRLFVNFNGGYRIGKPINGSTFPEFSDIYRIWISFLRTPPWSLQLQLYGSRGISYGQYIGNAYYFGSSGGAALVLQVGYRLKIRAYGELGENVYPVAVPDVSGALVKRVDDVTTYGGGIELLLFRNLSVTANAYNTEYDSNVPEFDRSALRFTTSFVLGVPIP